MKKGTPTRNIPLGVGVNIPNHSGVASNQKVKVEKFKTDISSGEIPYSDGTNLTSNSNFKWNISQGRLDLETTGAGTLLQLKSTDAGATSAPDLVLTRESASPAVNDLLGIVVFAGQDSGAVYQEYGNLQGYIESPTAGAEDGAFRFNVTKAGTKNIPVLHAKASEVVVNESGLDIDFRVETDTNANAFVIDAGAESTSIATTNIGFHTASPVVQQNAQLIIDNSGGVSSLPNINPITDAANVGSADLAPTADAIATLAASITEIRTALVNYGLLG